ncbi:MAG TPA: imidazole glycerol phosphate synthase subunit HisH [Parabacteroides sp.]|nr:imidazole glycerol phosphate synthase subunit HisH [Parabacteroides sp.]
MKVAIIDYDAGNLRNVERAAQRAGLDTVTTRNAEEIRAAKALILPGVGAMKDAMAHLDAYGLTPLLREEVAKGKKLMGICLGMQALYDVSEEGGEVPALGLLPGRIALFPEGTLKIPHMGWNTISDLKGGLFTRGLENKFVYFVHGFYVPTNTYTAATTDYILPFSASLHKDNFYATQFHPEKSGSVGEEILRNFINM